MNESNQEADPLIEQFRQLQPAKSTTDMRETFYRAGYEACRVQMRSNHSRHLAVGIAAALIAAMITLPTSYLAGKTAASGPSIQELAQADEADPLVARSDRDIQRDPRSASTPASKSPPLTHQPHDEEVAPIQLDEEVRLTHTGELASQRATHPFASWINPLRSIARSTKLDRQAESMQTTSHASLFVLESSIRNLSEMPFSITSSSRLSMSDADDPENSKATDSRPMLTVGDFNSLAIGLEAVK